MNIFYYNFTGRLDSGPFPEVLRARYLSLRGKKQTENYRLKIGFYLAIRSFSNVEQWRFAGEKNWHRYPDSKLILFPPGTELEFLVPAGMDRHGMMLEFVRGEALGIDRLFAGAGKLELEDQDGRFSSVIQKIAMLKPVEGSGPCWEAQARLFQLLALIHQCHQQTLSPDMAFADNVDNFLCCCLNRLITREELARQMNVSVSLLSHRYQRERGMPIMRRHLEMRLESARNLLMNGVPLGKIAESLAFNSPFHLSRAFKQKYGVSPAIYLKRNNLLMDF